MMHVSAHVPLNAVIAANQDYLKMALDIQLADSLIPDMPYTLNENGMLFSQQYVPQILQLHGNDLQHLELMLAHLLKIYSNGGVTVKMTEGQDLQILIPRFLQYAHISNFMRLLEQHNLSKLTKGFSLITFCKAFNLQRNEIAICRDNASPIGPAIAFIMSKYSEKLMAVIKKFFIENIELGCSFKEDSDQSIVFLPCSMFLEDAIRLSRSPESLQLIELLGLDKHPDYHNDYPFDLLTFPKDRIKIIRSRYRYKDQSEERSQQPPYSPVAYNSTRFPLPPLLIDSLKTCEPYNYFYIDENILLRFSRITELEANQVVSRVEKILLESNIIDSQIQKKLIKRHDRIHTYEIRLNKKSQALLAEPELFASIAPDILQRIEEANAQLASNLIPASAAAAVSDSDDDSESASAAAVPPASRSYFGDGLLVPRASDVPNLKPPAPSRVLNFLGFGSDPSVPVAPKAYEIGDDQL